MFWTEFFPTKLFSDKQNRDLRDSLMHSIAQLVTGQITERLTAIIMNEIPRHILPVIVSQLEKMKVQLMADIGQKLRGCDQVIKESVMNVTSSKVMCWSSFRSIPGPLNFFQIMQASMETFGNAVVVGVQAGLQKTYTDTLKTTILPSYERTTEELFRQIQTIFLQGTKSCKLTVYSENEFYLH